MMETIFDLATPIHSIKVIHNPALKRHGSQSDVSKTEHAKWLIYQVESVSDGG